jgi:hypothetical protein
LSGIDRYDRDARRTFCSELAALVSLLCYSLSAVVVFITAGVVMIGLFNVSTSEKVRPYSHPRPEIERTVTSPNIKPRLFMVVPQTKDELDVPGTAKKASETKDASPAKDIEVSRPIPIEKADAKKRKGPRAWSR